MLKREILGHIKCPVCDHEMRITPDKNGEPFGYCEVGCNLQLRIGGNAYRVGKFIARYPWAKPGAVPGQVAPKVAPAQEVVPQKPESDRPKPAKNSVFHDIF